MTHKFRLTGPNDPTSATRRPSVIRPGAAELLALYDLILVDPLDGDRSVHVLSPRRSRSSGQQEPSAAVCAALDEWSDAMGDLCGDSGEPVRNLEAAAVPASHLLISRGPAALRRTVYLSEDLDRLREWRATLPQRLLLVEVPHVLTVLDGLLVSDGMADDESLVTVAKGPMAIGARLGGGLHLVEMGSMDVEIDRLRAEDMVVEKLGHLQTAASLAGPADFFVRLATQVDDTAVVVQASASGGEIAASMPADLTSFPAGTTWPSSNDAQPPISERPVLRLLPVTKPPGSPGWDGWIRRLTSPAALTTLFGAAVALIFALRFGILAGGAAPPTIDAGNWLGFAQSLLGNSARDGSITYPPAVPLLTEVFTGVFGIKHGVAALGALSAIAPALGLYVALGMARVGRLRIIPSMLLLGSGSVGEAAAWGGFPQLLALAILPIVLVLFLRFVDVPSRRAALALGVGVFASLATSHFISAILLLAMASAAVTESMSARKPVLTRPHLKLMGYVALPSLLLTGTYLKLVDAVIFNRNEYAKLDNLTWSDVLPRMDTVYSEFPALWQILVPLALVTPALTWSQRRSVIWRMSTSVLVATSTLLLLTQEGRYLYLIPLAAVLSLGVWAIELPRILVTTDIDRARFVCRFLGVIAGILVVVQLDAGIGRFDDQRDFYAVLTPGLVDAIEAADTVIESTGGEDTNAIAIPSLNDAPVGWWVEALTDEVVVYGSPLRWLNFGDELERARIANEIFRPEFPASDTLDLLEAAEIRVVILPRRWAWYDDEAVDKWIADNDLYVVERNKDALTIDLT